MELAGFASGPQQIICLTAGHADILSAIGAADRIVGISGWTTDSPELKEKPKVGSFTTMNIEKILDLKPDLVLAFSDLQADLVRELIKSGLNVLATNQRTIPEILQNILLLGSIVNRPAEARALVGHMESAFDVARRGIGEDAERPRIYFEEWDDPMISGIAWVSELIEIAGGDDIFPELRGQKNAPGRVVSPQRVIERDPEIIFACWCGKKLDVGAIQGRAGWQKISAIRHNRIYEILPQRILQPGPRILEGLQDLVNIIQSNRRTKIHHAPQSRASYISFYKFEE